MKTDAALLADLIKESRQAAFFGGAGVSTESGIPDFRSPSGLWTRMKPILFQDFVSSREVRREAWKRRFEGEDTIALAEPNAGHRAIASLVATGKAAAIVTQNIDGLHQAAGSRTVYELHGSTLRNYCTRCGKFYDVDFIANSTGVPRCTECGGAHRCCWQ